MNTGLHAVADAERRPIGFFMPAGQVSDHTGATALLGRLPKPGWLPGDRDHDADWFREALKDKGIKVCIPGRKSRKTAVKYPSRDIPAECPAGQWTNASTNGGIVSRSCSGA